MNRTLKRVIALPVLIVEWGTLLRSLLARKNHGRHAMNPGQIPLRGWGDIAVRVWRQAHAESLNVLAAGIAFYAFLTLLPLIASIALGYSLFANPAEVLEDVQRLIAVIPGDGQALVGEVLKLVVSDRDGREYEVAGAVAVALYSAVLCARSLMAALNIIYHEPRRSRFIVRWGLALVIAAGGAAFLLLALLAIAVLGYVDALVPEGTPLLWGLIRLGFWAMMTAGASIGFALLYRYAPSRKDARWSFVLPGAVTATALWLTATLGFSVYIANFGSYDAAYGSLAAVVVLEVWLFLSAFAVLLGAKLNAAIELQTTMDTTVGPTRPAGQRGAAVADHVGEADDAIVLTGKDRDDR